MEEQEQNTSRLDDSKRWVSGKMEQIKPAVRNAGLTVQRELRAKPAMYAGIAAGIGFALGLAGRIARHRRHRRRASKRT